MCTHLHADHVGWNTRLESGRWLPTFPNARYVMSQREIDQRARDAAQSPQANHGSYQDSVLPVLDAGLAQVAQAGDEIAEGMTIVDLAGHAPGQIGLDVATAAGSNLLFCGDAIHSPAPGLSPGMVERLLLRSRSSGRYAQDAACNEAASEDLLLLPAPPAGSRYAYRREKRSFCPGHRAVKTSGDLF